MCLIQQFKFPTTVQAILFHFRYPLLLTRIYRATQRGNPDREALLSARRKIEEQIGRINEASVCVSF